MTIVARIVGGTPMTLAEVERHVWTMLHRAAALRRHDWNTPGFATNGADGPQVRTVVLRAVDPVHRRLLLYADVRSRKVAEVRADGRVAWCFWDHASKTQLRAQADARVANPATTRACFEGLLLHQWRDYVSRSAPGQPWNLDAERPHDGDPATHFAVIESVVRSLDWLKLERDGHLRARFDYGADGGALANWLVP